MPYVVAAYAVVALGLALYAWRLRVRLRQARELRALWEDDDVA